MKTFSAIVPLAVLISCPAITSFAQPVLIPVSRADIKLVCTSTGALACQGVTDGSGNYQAGLKTACAKNFLVSVSLSPAAIALIKSAYPQLQNAQHFQLKFRLQSVQGNGTPHVFPPQMISFPAPYTSPVSATFGECPYSINVPIIFSLTYEKPVFPSPSGGQNPS